MCCDKDLENFTTVTPVFVFVLTTPLSLDEPVPQDIVDDLVAFSEKLKAETMALGPGHIGGGKYRNGGEYRGWNADLVRVFPLRETSESANVR